MSARTSCAVGLALFTCGVGIHCAPPAHDSPPAALSILAVGDTGKPHPWPAFLRSGQMRVARGMNAEDVRSPAGTLLLLGDNFYPEGLTEPELVARLRENLATPYCRFLELAGPRSAALADLCPESAAAGERRILAVLGNHDIVAESSAALQRDAIPEFVSNWRLLDGCAGSVELGHGV
ncbi:MAG: hypothetical protein O7G30_02740, partial [Proteobacteria bacterium]|nr:hypothetical protein [Pseudomonadota bacterium]